ncbi:MAG: iron-containing alcohol dehydrogenase [Bacilli bacterium]
MENFIYDNKTKIIFGRDVENTCAQECQKYGQRILIHYGGGSIVRSGLLDRVMSKLKEAKLEVHLLGGIVPNPRLKLVYEGIELVKKKKIDLILAIGGGSVIDSAKAIALGAKYDGDVWDFFAGKAVPTDILPLGTILTIPAAGSESSNSTVITKDDGLIKRSFRNNINRPLFSFLNPTLIATVPKKHLIAGVVDMYSHIIERYFTNVEHVLLTTELCEAGMRAIKELGPKFLKDPANYDYAAEIMWASTVAHNALFETGRIADWASHGIEHELSAEYDLSHGLGLAIIVPAWMKYVYRHNVPLFARYARKVYDVSIEDDEKAALEGIKKTQAFFESLGAETSLVKAKVPTDKFEFLAKRATLRGPLGQFVKLTASDIVKIYELAR